MSAGLGESMEKNEDNERIQIKSEEGGDSRIKTESTVNNDNPVENTNQNNKSMNTDPNHKSKAKTSSSKATSNETIQIRSRTRSRSRSASRSQIRSTRKQTPFRGRASTNPFLLFLQEFRQNHAGMRSKEIAKLAGERWRQMTQEQKLPYIDSAKKSRQRNSEEKRKNSSHESNISIESKKSYSKGKKKRRNRRETDSDSTSVSSGTADTATTDNGTE